MDDGVGSDRWRRGSGIAKAAFIVGGGWVRATMRAN